jgi:hypothetical protein
VVPRLLLLREVGVTFCSQERRPLTARLDAAGARDSGDNSSGLSAEPVLRALACAVGGAVGGLAQQQGEHAGKGSCVVCGFVLMARCDSGGARALGARLQHSSAEGRYVAREGSGDGSGTVTTVFWITV